MKRNKFSRIPHIGAICLSALAASAFCATAQTAQRLEATKANDYAVIYSMPATMVDVTLEAEITVKRPGEFYKYAPKYLNVNNPITAESHSVKLLSAVIGTHGIADPDQQFAVTFKSSNPVVVNLDSNGVPLSINTEETPSVDAPVLPEAQVAKPTPLESAAARQVVTQEMIQSQSTAKKAELAAQAIFNIRQTINDLNSGQAETMPPDGASLKLMLDNLHAQEDALTAMFLGTTSVSTQVKTITIDPAKLADNDTFSTVIARLSPLDGIVDSENLSGAPVTLTLNVESRGEMPVNEKGQELPFPKNGIPYVIPGQLSATVSYEGDTYCTATLSASQLGIIYGLAPNSFTDRKAPIAILYDPATGAILRQFPALR